MARRNVIVMGGSTGSLEVIRTIVSGLPRTLDASIFVVVHTSPDSPGLLDRLFGRVALLPVKYASDRERIVPGRIYLAAPDVHLIVKRTHVRLSHGPRENWFRPAIDPLFRSAAVAHGSRVIGVVVSGGQDDGAVGLRVIKNRGGLAVVQDPVEALVPSMPLAAIRHAAPDHVVSASEIPALLARLTAETLPKSETKRAETVRSGARSEVPQ